MTPKMTTGVDEIDAAVQIGLNGLTEVTTPKSAFPFNHQEKRYLLLATATTRSFLTKNRQDR